MGEEIGVECEQVFDSGEDKKRVNEFYTCTVLSKLLIYFFNPFKRRKRNTDAEFQRKKREADADSESSADDYNESKFMMQ